MLSKVRIEYGNGQVNDYILAFSDSGTIQVGQTFKSGRIQEEWVRLGYSQCPDCSLQPDAYPYCPVAASLAQYARDMAGRSEDEKVKVTLAFDDGATNVEPSISLRTVVDALVRLSVFQTLCPVGRQVKPGLKDLAPFAQRDDVLSAAANFFLQQVQGTGVDGGDSDSMLGDFTDTLTTVLEHLEVRFQVITSGSYLVSGDLVVDALARLRHLFAPDLMVSAVRAKQGF